MAHILRKMESICDFRIESTQKFVASAPDVASVKLTLSWHVCIGQRYLIELNTDLVTHFILAFGFKLMHVRITTTSHPNSSSRLESNSVTIRSEHNVSIFW